MKKINFEAHVTYIERKITCDVGILTKLKYYFPKKYYCNSTIPLFILTYFMLFLYGDPHIKPIFKKSLLFKTKQLKV